MRYKYDIHAVVGTKILIFQSYIENIMYKKFSVIFLIKKFVCLLVCLACRFIINVKICFFDVRESCCILTYSSRKRKELEGKCTRRPSSE